MRVVKRVVRMAALLTEDDVTLKQLICAQHTATQH